MNAVFGNLLNGLTEIWRNIGIAQKVSIILIMLASAGVIGGILYFGSRPDWQILYSNLDAKTAAKVSDIVRDSNVPLSVTDGGRTIMVPSKDVYNLRMKVSSAGVTVDAKGTGLELFDNMQLGLTDKQQQIAYQRAIQGELQRMIGEMPAISDAKVMITMPPRSVFKKENSRPSASVLLVMQRGGYLSPDQINSIRYMVASAVPGMTPDDVTITDNLGRLLRRQVVDGAGSGADAGSRLEFRARIESDLKEKAEAILRPIIGADKVVAMVSCDIDFDDIDRVVETINNEQSAVISEKMVTDDSSKSGATRSGPQPTGAAANQNARVELSVNNPEGGDQPKLSSDQRKTVERQFIVPKSMEKTTIKGGRIRKLTVAVTVGQKEDGKTWSSDEMASFERLVTAAVGVSNYKIEKNEKPVTVQQLPFIKEKQVGMFNQIPVTDRIMQELEKLATSGLIRPVAGILIMLLLYGIFRKYFSRQSVEGSELGSGFSEELYGGTEEVRPIPSTESRQLANESIADALQNKVKATPQSIAEFMENWLAQG